MAALLIAHGAMVDAEDQIGNTPLWRATFDSRGRGELTSILLGASADRNHLNRMCKTPLDLAKLIANYDVMQFLVRRVVSKMTVHPVWRASNSHESTDGCFSP